MSSNPQMILFASVFTLFSLALSFYLGKRLISPAKLVGWRRLAAWSAIALLAASGPVVMIGNRWIAPSPTFATVQWLGFVGMGAGALLIVLALARDLIWWGARGLSSLRRRWRKAPQTDAAEGEPLGLLEDPSR